MTEIYRVLLVEDEESLRKGMEINLEMEGYEVVSTDDGKKALGLVRNQRFDIIILDVMLPNLDGFRVCEQIRLDGFQVPIIFVTAKDGSNDRIQGLKKGGDDYLIKPFNLEELILRVRNLIRRSQPSEVIELGKYEFGQNSINFSTYEARHKTNIFQLTHKEAMLMKLLIERKNEVVPREQILQAVWGYDVYPSTRTIDNFILALRKRFEENPRSPQYIKSVRGVGYKFQN